MKEITEQGRMTNKGQSLVEFAMIMTLLFFLLFVLFDFGRAVLDYSILNNAVREGTRLAIVDNNQTNIMNQITEYVYNLQGFNSSMVSFPNPSAEDKIKIQITYPFTPTIPGLMSLFGAGDTINITVQSEMYLTRASSSN